MSQPDPHGGPACPSPELLESLARGQLDLAKVGSVRQHLEGCPACSTEYERCVQDEQMGEFLREARQQLDRGEREKLLRSTLRKLESQEFRRCEESHPT